MNFLSSIHKQKRVILGSVLTPENCITIFLGLYNATEYIDGIKHQLQNQTNQNFILIVADNDSSDKTWQSVQPWITEFPGRILLVKNYKNLGGTGNLIQNLDLIKTEWFCAFHQDDHYKANHISTLVDEILVADRNTIAISTDMGSLNHDGKISARRTRASWFMDNDDPVEAFISNLFAHNIYWPSTAFKTSIYQETSKTILWHSATFPDTEIILKMCAKGTFKRVRKETMYYRENLNSESRSINILENNYGVFTALNRVFNSNYFSDIAINVKVDKRYAFLDLMQRAIKMRITDPILSRGLILILHEVLATIWGYEDESNTYLLAKLFNEFDSKHSVEILRNCQELIGANETKLSPDDWNFAFLNKSITKKNYMRRPFDPKHYFKIIYSCIFKLIPYGASRFILRHRTKLKVYSSSNHPWKFIFFKNK
jgi:glycosyltransferase involved in cell wall biosynthesis